MKLTNGEVFVAWDGLDRIMQEKLPVKVGMGLAKIRTAILPAYKEILEVRDSLIKTHGDDQPNGQKGLVGPNNPDGKEISKGWEAFIEAHNTLMNVERDEDFTISKVKLTETVAATCDKCHHNMDKPFEISGVVILALEKFIEV